MQAASLRAVDLLAVLADPAALPIAGPLHARLDLHRRAAAEAPWLQAVVHGLELADYRALPAHQPGWLSARLDLPPGEEDRCLALLGRVDAEANPHDLAGLVAACESLLNPDGDQELAHL